MCVVVLQVLDEAHCRKLGMGLFLGVAQGSDEPLRFIHLTYTPEGPITHKASHKHQLHSMTRHGITQVKTTPA